MSYEDNLISKIAWMYYKEGLTQQQIANALHLSRLKVLKYLEIARARNIVQFNVNLECDEYISQANTLIRHFGLDEVYIAPSCDRNPSNTVAMAAAQYLNSKLENTPRLSINFGAGKTTSTMLSYVNVKDGMALTLISLTGGVHYYIHPQGQFNIIHSGSERITSHIIPAPMRALSEEAAAFFLSEPSISNILKMCEYADMTMLGIGSIQYDSTMIEQNIISREEMDFAKLLGAEGNLLSQFFDIDGNIVDFSVHKCLVALNLERLKKLRNVVGIAAGSDKVRPIIGALNGHYLNTLITDENTAHSIIQYISQTTL